MPLVGPAVKGIDNEIAKFFQPKPLILRQGSKSPLVRAVQQRLSELDHVVDIDGIYGPETAAAVSIFQAKEKLGVDGLCGQETLTALFHEVDIEG